MSKELSPLEHLEFIRNYEIDDEHRTLNMNYATRQSLDIIETALKERELMKDIVITARFDLAQVNKEHKALEIIREKTTDACNCLMILKARADNLDYSNYKKLFLTKLTQEEFDLLKEVL